jgi:hypothetical protein
MALVAALAVAGCNDERDLAPSGPTSERGVVVESAELETIGFEFRCEVHGDVGNVTTRNLKVTLTFRAFDPEGAVIGTAVVDRRFVPAGGRSHYEADFHNFSDDGFLNDCDRVHRFEVVSIETRPA